MVVVVWMDERVTVVLDKPGCNSLALDGLAGHDFSAVTGGRPALDIRRVLRHDDDGSGSEQSGSQGDTLSVIAA